MAKVHEPGRGSRLTGYVFTIWEVGRVSERTIYAESERKARNKLGLVRYAHVTGVRILDEDLSHNLDEHSKREEQ
jgi:hypothetical protein